MMMSTCCLLNKVDVNMLLKVHFQPNLGHETQKMMDKQYTVGALLCLRLSGLGVFTRQTTSLVLEAPVTFGVVT